METCGPFGTAAATRNCGPVCTSAATRTTALFCTSTSKPSHSQSNDLGGLRPARLTQSPLPQPACQRPAYGASCGAHPAAACSGKAAAAQPSGGGAASAVARPA
eukprot:7391564-Prymnesium_polylepis.4